MAAQLANRLTRQTLRGTWATVLLPLDAKERIDYSSLARQLAFLTGSGVDGVYTNGTAGEFQSIDEDEYDRISQLVRAGCTDLPCQLGASHPTAPGCLSRIRRAAQLRPDAIQVILPDWLPLSMEETIRTIEGYLIASDGVPLVLYNPPHAKTRLGPANFGELAERFPALIGVKVAGGDADWYRRMQDAVGDLAVFVGGHTLATGLARGAHGAYSNVACLSPEGAVRWYRQMRDHPVDALRVEQLLDAFLREHVRPLQQRGFSNAALDKALAAAGRWADINPRLRWPYLGVPVPDVEPLTRAADPIIRALLADRSEGPLPRRGAI
jgi:dihydrodipicolinate synthase/N-acetylneuraminate lyase